MVDEHFLTGLDGELMAERLATGRTPELMAPFAPDRFAKDRMVPDATSAGTH